jgi:hypothetical protein
MVRGAVGRSQVEINYKKLRNLRQPEGVWSMWKGNSDKVQVTRGSSPTSGHRLITRGIAATPTTRCRRQSPQASSGHTFNWALAHTHLDPPIHLPCRDCPTSVWCTTISGGSGPISSRICEEAAAVWSASATNLYQYQKRDRTGKVYFSAIILYAAGSFQHLNQ